MHSKRDDSLWKGILENITDDFFCFFFKDADILFDFDKGFQFLDKELEQLFPSDESNAPKFVDKLIKVFTREGKEEWFLCHIEVQGYEDKNFARRMFTYFYRILDKYGKPITAISIFTDVNRKFHPKMYKYEYLGTKNTFEFNTYKVIEQDEQQLILDDNPFAMVVLTVLLALKKKALNDEDLYNLKYSLARNLLGKSISKKKVSDLLIFLKLYVRFDDPSFNVKFDKEIEEIIGNTTTMGIREMVLERAKKEGLEEGISRGVEEGMQTGIKKGREESKAEFVKNLLATGRFSEKEIANLSNASEEFVANVRKDLP